MTNDQQPTTNLSRMPQLRSRWWSALLALSLAANLLIVGAAIGHRVWGDAEGRRFGDNYVRLVPRKFFAELPMQRRRELMDVVRQDMDGLRNIREQGGITILHVADALEKQPYDPALVQQAVTEFATGSQSLAGKGANILIHLVEKLTPDERVQLASAIRERDLKGKKDR
jgi:uncharacterized membrane protein